MKLLNKTYLLVGILIAAAGVNLYLLYEVQQIGTAESYTILRVGDLKVKTETVSKFASSIASGNNEDRENLKNEIQEYEKILEVLETGGSYKEQSIVKVPDNIKNYFDNSKLNWESYKNNADQVQQTSVFDQNAVEALNYVLEKNGEMILTTDSVVKEFDELGRDFNRHKEIAMDLQELAKSIGQQALLISIGEGEGAQDQLKRDRISFEIGLRKLLQIPATGLDLQLVGESEEELEEVPRENSESLRKLDPLWEAVQLRVATLEERSLLSEDFDMARKNLQSQRDSLQSSLDNLIDAWNIEVNKGETAQQTIIQILLGVDIAVFFVVLFVIRQSLNPISIITSALSRVKEGVYGERIVYNAKDEVGELVSTFNIMSDTIKQKEEEARRNDQSKDEFLAMITHELKTPLVPIQGYADILLSEHLGTLTEKQKERLQIIKTSSESLLDIISDLLDAQKLELGQLRMKKESHSIKDTVDRAIRALKPQADRNGVKLTTQGPDVLVLHDTERIGQVLTNLIKNSLNAVKQESGAIEVSIEDKDENVILSVKDNGIGIPEDKQKDLFKKFYQVDATLTRERGGSGLGLAICRGIVDGHGGEISVQSTLNIGTTFTVKIPKNP